jgi:hypothetical protein
MPEQLAVRASVPDDTEVIPPEELPQPPSPTTPVSLARATRGVIRKARRGKDPAYRPRLRSLNSRPNQNCRKLLKLREQTRSP